MNNKVTIYSFAIYDKKLSEREIKYIYARDRGLPLPELLGNPTFLQKIKLSYQLFKITFFNN